MEEKKSKKEEAKLTKQELNHLTLKKHYDHMLQLLSDLREAWKEVGFLVKAPGALDGFDRETRRLLAAPIMRARFERGIEHFVNITGRRR